MKCHNNQYGFFKRILLTAWDYFFSSSQEEGSQIETSTEESPKIKKQMTRREDFLLLEFNQIQEFLEENNEIFTSIQLLKKGTEEERRFQVHLESGYTYIFSFLKGELIQIHKDWNNC